MKKRHLSWLVCLLMGALLASPSRAQEPVGAPFTETELPGWSWWCHETMCALLPDEGLGPQRRFLLVTRPAAIDGMEAGWLGGGRVVWEGVVTTRAGRCRGRIATNGDTRGFLATSEDWSVAAIGPEDSWQVTAGLYNEVLRGQP